MKQPRHSIRLTGGQFSRAELDTPTGATHPMGSRERLALFNILSALLPASADANPFTGQQVLDLFAGSGALGAEALSRGAASVVFVEKSPAACTIIRANLAKLGVSAKATVIQGEVNTQTFRQQYDLVLVDPPYDHPEFFTPQSINIYANFVKSGATLVLSRPQNHPIPPTDTLKLEKSRSYAALTLDFFTKL